MCFTQFVFILNHHLLQNIMTKTIVIFHSGYGHTERVAKSVAEGANASLISIDSEGNLPSASSWDELNDADAIIFGSPTYMGSASWQFKKFADASSKSWFVRAWQDKIFGGFTNSASLVGDKGNTMAFLNTLAAQHGGIWVSLGMLSSNKKTSTRNDLNSLGGSTGLLVQCPSDAAVSEMLEGDLETARLYGARVAGIAARMKK
jgi:NAD(P)H dehydrogenase (quinone)